MVSLASDLIFFQSIIHANMVLNMFAVVSILVCSVLYLFW
jgi:hypothetical protein